LSAPRRRAAADLDLEPDELGGDFGKALRTPLSPANFKHDRAPLNPTEFAHSLDKSGNPWPLDRSRPGAEQPDFRQFSRLLRARRERPRRRRAPDEWDEIASSQGWHGLSP